MEELEELTDDQLAFVVADLTTLKEERDKYKQKYKKLKEDYHQLTQLNVDLQKSNFKPFYSLIFTWAVICFYLFHLCRTS